MEVGINGNQLFNLFSKIPIIKNHFEKKYIESIADSICRQLKHQRAIIKKLEEKYGDWDMPVDLPDGSKMSPEEYLKTLAEIVDSGMFSKEAILKMAALSEQIYSGTSRNSYTKQLIIGGVVIFVLIGIVIIISMGGAK